MKNKINSYRHSKLELVLVHYCNVNYMGLGEAEGVDFFILPEKLVDSLKNALYNPNLDRYTDFITIWILFPNNDDLFRIDLGRLYYDLALDFL